MKKIKSKKSPSVLSLENKLRNGAMDCLRENPNANELDVHSYLQNVQEFARALSTSRLKQPAKEKLIREGEWPVFVGFGLLLTLFSVFMGAKKKMDAVRKMNGSEEYDEEEGEDNEEEEPAFNPSFNLLNESVRSTYKNNPPSPADAPRIQIPIKLQGDVRKMDAKKSREETPPKRDAEVIDLVDITGSPSRTISTNWRDQGLGEQAQMSASTTEENKRKRKREKQVLQEVKKVNVVKSKLVADTPSTRFRDLGGMGELISYEVKNNILLPFLRPELFSCLGVRPTTGILLHGPPGCGKVSLLTSKKKYNKFVLLVQHLNNLSFQYSKLLAINLVNNLSDDPRSCHRRRALCSQRAFFQCLCHRTRLGNVGSERKKDQKLARRGPKLRSFDRVHRRGEYLFTFHFPCTFSTQWIQDRRYSPKEGERDQGNGEAHSLSALQINGGTEQGR